MGDVGTSVEKSLNINNQRFAFWSQAISILLTLGPFCTESTSIVSRNITKLFVYWHLCFLIFINMTILW